MIIWVSGPTGAGKTTLATALGGLDYAIVPESVPAPLMAAFANDPVRNGERLQAEIMRRRKAAWRAVADSDRVVFDRSISEDVEVFCRLHAAEGRLLDKQFARLASLSAELQSDMPRPDLIVFATANIDVLTARCVVDRQPTFIRDSLSRQISLYAGWLASRVELILRVDTSHCSARSIRDLLDVKGA
jgi:deoxyadenosine/deoxycytidine kinase